MNSLRSIALPSKNSPGVSYLTTEQVLVVHFRLIQETGGSQGLRDLSLLESAVARPRAGFGDTEIYPYIFTTAAALLESLVQNQPFLDGNKRTGIAATGLFLRLSGWRLAASQDLLVAFVLSVATESQEIHAIATWLRERCISSS